MPNAKDPINEIKGLLREHDAVCDKHHAEVKQEFKETGGGVGVFVSNAIRNPLFPLASTPRW